MAIVTINYNSAFYNRVIKVSYDDINHLVSNGAKQNSSSGGIGEGVEIYRQNGVGTDYYSVRSQNAAPYAYVEHITGPVLPEDIDISSVDVVNYYETTPPTLGSLTVHATGSGTLRYSLSGKPVQVSNVFNNLNTGQYTIKVSRVEDSIFRTVITLVIRISELAMTLSKSDITASGAEDGIIRAQIFGGEGPYTITLYDVDGNELDSLVFTSTQINNNEIPTFENIGPGSYTVIVSDSSIFPDVQSSIVLTDPASINIYPGTIFKFPFICSISMVTKDGNSEQGLDNVLFKDQIFKGYTDNCYFQKINKSDRPIIQFLSDYTNHLVELYNYKTNALIQSYQVETREDNLHQTVSFGITLKADSAGRSRLYFDTPIIPLPFNVTDIFDIEDSGEGFNGTYAIVDIQTDATSGFQYLIITKNYGGAGPTSLASGVFKSPIKYNVYESTITFETLDEGKYYLKVSALSPVLIEAISEPIHLKESHEGTCTIVYSNLEDAYDTLFSTGYRGFMRIPSLFGHKRYPGGTRVLSRNSNYSLNKVSSKKTRVLEWEVFALPPYLHEKLSVVCDLDVYSINGVPVQSSDGYKEPDYKDRSLLADSSVMVEQLNWFDNYNTNGLMSNISGAGCLCDTIDLVSAGASTPTINLNMNSKKQRIFKASLNIAANKEVIITNDTAGLSFSFVFSINEGIILQFPDTFNVRNNNEFDNATKEWTCSATGRYVMEMIFDGTNWYGTIVG